MNTKQIIRRLLPMLALLIGVLVACSPQPETITVEVEVTRQVESVVETEVEVTREVEVESVVQTEVEVVVTATPAPGGGQVVYGLYQEPQILNPLIATQTAASETYSPVIEGLIAVDPDGNFFAVLAKEVPTVENGLVSEDGLQVTFNLREDVLWSDGKPFTCDDVLFTFRARMHPEGGSASTSGYDSITLPADFAQMIADPEAEVETDPTDGGGLVCVDDYTVQLTFEEFFASYLRLFDRVIPRHATGDPAEMQKWIYNWHPIGTGPFKIQEWISGDQIILVPNENFRDPDKPNLDKLIIRIIPSREVGKALIRTGEIDILWDLTEADVPEFDEIPEVVVNFIASPSTERLLLNLADPTIDATDDPLGNPHWALGDVRVRQALEIAIDKAFINEVLLYGLATPGTSELNIGWSSADIAPSEFNPDGAEALLEEAGWTDGDGDGIRECNGCLYAEAGRALSLKIQTTTGNKLREEVEQVLVEMLGDVGVDLFIENAPSSVLFGSWSSGAFRKHGSFDILMYTTSGGIDPQRFLENYHSSYNIPTEANNGTGFNYSRWVNEDYDALIQAAGAEPDIVARQKLYQQAMEILTSEVPHIYLYDRADVHLSRDRVLGFRVTPWGNQTWNAGDWAVDDQ